MLGLGRKKAKKRPARRTKTTSRKFAKKQSKKKTKPKSRRAGKHVKSRPISAKITVKKPVKRTAKKATRISKSTRQPSIEFCSKCGSIMIPVKKSKNIYIMCRRCGAGKKKITKYIKIREAPVHKRDVAVLEKDITPLPVTIRECERCGNTNAYFWLQQTRSADEPPTQFFRCTKCKNTWREYK